MLERVTVRRRFVRLGWRQIACAVTVGCGVLAMWALLRPIAVVRIGIPAPPLVVAVPAQPTVIVQPAPPPPSPPPPPAPRSSPVGHIGCSADIAAIGIPVAHAPDHVDAPNFVEVSVSREGCTIAARTASSIEVSYDGGQSFAHDELTGARTMAAADARVMVLRSDGTLGTMLPGKPITWRSPPAALADPILFAAGKWTVLATAKLVGISDDDGASWRYIELPDNLQLSRLDADGNLFGARSKAIVEPDGMGPGVYETTREVTELVHPRWRTIATIPGTPADDSGRYVLETDEFWGCGSSQALEVVEGGRTTLVAGHLRDEVWPIEVRTNGGVTFASLNNQLVRLDGARRITVGDIPGHLAAVDARGTAIVHAERQLLRWSKVGGWRVLVDAH